MHSALYTGRLRHRRHAPRSHAFTYSVCMAFIDLSEIDEVFRNRWLWSARRPRLVWLRRADFLGDPALSLDEAVRSLVQERTGLRPGGAIRMLAQLRSFGASFNPVTFYYCFAPGEERVEAIVAQITNTPWGERHAYVLPIAGSSSAATSRLPVRQELPRLAVHADGAALSLAIQRSGAAAAGPHGQSRVRQAGVRRHAGAAATRDHGPDARLGTAAISRCRAPDAGCHLLAGAAPVDQAHTVPRAPVKKAPPYGGARVGRFGGKEATGSGCEIVQKYQSQRGISGQRVAGYCRVDAAVLQ